MIKILFIDYLNQIKISNEIKIISNNNLEYNDEFISNILQIETTNYYQMDFVHENINNLIPLQTFNLFCNDWNDQNDLQFNALINGVQISSSFVNDARLLQSITPVGDIIITVLLAYPEYPNAIKCYNINNTYFKEVKQ